MRDGGYFRVADNSYGKKMRINSVRDGETFGHAYCTLTVKTNEWVVPAVASVTIALVVPDGVATVPPPPPLFLLPPHPSAQASKTQLSAAAAAVG